ncbi:peptide chain release factor N(5)-glutamine methyltransferase [Hyphobacterium marinum]|uniref:Release factor glutamine methyltransferase n=1 Tax=Hyphobacterium marinum TaxID=3116574 RepID=A0ABU7LXC6_9PROT|nr:peptide chain release factor N(5)-glutamine methyltransferase [Hyphobacterium sp. Y6023]MEE2566226.1 peptide chain release factor N(5)-glutamine methyltransferase [Hyphobacterium sp. Y6023]
MTRDDLKSEIAAWLRAAGIDEAALEARHILAAASSEAEARDMAQRRAAREPLSLILGNQPFWTLDLRVTPDVLTPRADTETLVEWALSHLADGGRVVDLGTGSGAILLAILSERPNASGVGIDSSAAALQVAEENARRNNLADRCDFRAGNWADGLPGNAFDLAVSNPPYIASAVLETLDPEVTDHEPYLALDGGADGLDCYRLLVPQLFRILRPGGHAAVEIGYDQAEAVNALFAAAGFADVALSRDLAGNPRVISGQKTETQSR